MSQLAKQEPAPEYTRADFVICDDDNESFCFHVYNNLEDAGHLGHNIRNPTEAELPEFIKGDQETLTRCAEESCDECGYIVNPEDKERHKGHELVEENIHEGDDLVEVKHAPICYSCHLPIDQIVFKDASAFVYSFSHGAFDLDRCAVEDVSYHCGNILENEKGLSTGLCDAVIEDWVQKLISPPKAEEEELVIIQKVTPYMGDDTWLDCGGDHLKEKAPEMPFDFLTGNRVMYFMVYVKGSKGGPYMLSQDHGYATIKEATKTAERVYPGARILLME